MGGATCTGSFMQEVISSGGNSYYHVVIGDAGSNFALEYYIRTATGSTCWYGCANARITGGMGGGGMGGGMGGGVAPLSVSSGAGGLNGNNTDPLGNSGFSGNGTGRPDQVVIRMINNSSEMQQEFLKATEINKPKITQNITTADMTSNFVIDMSKIDYNTTSKIAPITLTQTINSADLPVQQGNYPDSKNFDINNFTGTRTVTGGRYTYNAGSGDGGSAGTYTYFADGFDVYGVDWRSFCDPNQNPSGCSFGGNAGGMMGGTSGGMTSGTTTTTAGATTTTTTLSSGGGMGGSGTTTTTAATTTSTTASSSTTTTTTTTSGGGMGGSGTTTTTITTTTTTTTSSSTTSTTTTSSTTTTLSGGGMGGM